MRNSEKSPDFLRYLKDESFIAWKLFQTDETKEYWDNYLCEHPEERKAIELAEEHFRKIKLSSYAVRETQKREGLQILIQALNDYRRRRKRRIISYVTAACALLIAVSLLYRITLRRDESNKKLLATTGYIVGSELESEDITLITGKESRSFQKNVDIEIVGNGTARVESDNREDEEISIAEEQMNRLIVPYGKRSKIVLSDSTRVWLNSGSVLEFPGNFGKGERKIFLASGEIYLEVASDKTREFHVLTTDFNVKVHGTRFNISVYEKRETAVVLVEGSVSLRSIDGKQLLLTPEEKAVYSKSEGFTTQKVDVDQYISWKNGYLTFDETPLTEVLIQIARYYNLSFNYDQDVSLSQLTCTGKIILTENLDHVMTTIALISATQYKRANQSIYIYKD
ncbi:MAG: FecR domain-containing protein [Proteiniphilum sp.]|nr:FecR domain-containing protein [Proteiniphilum sp.]